MKKTILLILFLPVLVMASLDVKKISYDEILVAMKTQSGYNVTATTNVARFQISVLIHIVNNSLKIDPGKKILFLDNKIWYKAYKRYTGLLDEEMPDYSHKAIEYNQDQLLDLRKDYTIKNVKIGSQPQLVMNAIVGWKSEDKFYTFDDTLSTPTLKVRNSKQITYRILDFGDMVMYDEMAGLSGQPTSGILGWIFRLIGEGHVMWSKLTVTHTNEEIVCARAKKGPFEVESVLTIYPNGKTVKNIPIGRRDLKPYKNLVSKTIEVDYYPIDPETIKYICGK